MKSIPLHSPIAHAVLNRRRFQDYLPPSISFRDSSSIHVTVAHRQAPVVMSHDGAGTGMSSSESKANLRYTSDSLKTGNGVPATPYTSSDDYVNGKQSSETVQHVVIEHKRAAKIHDFCFGIPFGGIVFSGGLVGFIFSRNPTTLFTGVVYGGALLALSTFSLKIWRQGKSSVPFILGQAGLAAALLWKNLQTYLLTKKLFPTGFHVVISAAMLGFYAYVVASGGNPPPKKSSSPSAAPS